jgi:uncharacterized protein YwbE
MTNAIEVVYGEHIINVEVVGGRGLTGPIGPMGPAIGDILTTKGDLAVQDDTTAVRLPVGTIGQLLTVDPSQPTGVKWSILDGGTP